MIPVVGLAGRSGAGKSTVAEYLRTRHRFRELGFSTALKYEIAQQFPNTWRTYVEAAYPFVREPDAIGGAIRSLIWTDRDAFARAFLQEYGAAQRAADRNYWVKAWLRALAALPQWQNVVVPDVRFRNEVDAIRRRGLVVLVTRAEGVRLDGDAATHSTETGLAGWTGWDVTLPNDGTLEDLYHHVETRLVPRLALSPAEAPHG